MLRFEPRERGLRAHAPPSPTPAMPASPPLQPRPQYFGPALASATMTAPATATQPRAARRRASTSAAGAGMPATAQGGLPVLNLTAAQADQLRAIETKLLEQYLERYDAFVEIDQRTIDTGLWKQTRQANGVKVYRRRGANPTSRSSRGRIGRPGSVASPSDADEPMLLVVGSIEGTLEDVLYGAVWSSRDERSTRTYYTKDGVVDAAVLASLERPSPMNPFRSLAVKWSLKRSMRSAAVIKDRDFVFLGSTGTLRSRSDERIGYELRHSLKIPSFPPIAGSTIIRAEIMSCSFFRQMRGGRVEVYHQVSFNAGGDLLSILAWNHAVDSYVGFGAIVECSLTKKLVRAVQWSSENPPIKAEEDPDARPWDPEDRRCGVCGTPSSSLQRRCALCHTWVCSHCSLRREIFTPLPGRPSVARCFCKTCYNKVHREDPTEYVLRELEQFEHRTATEYARSPQIAVIDPRNGDIPPPPPPPPPSSEATESVFFAIDASPPQPPRRRQGSVPAPPSSAPVASAHPPMRHTSVTFSERVSEDLKHDINDENRVPNIRRSNDGRGRDIAAVGRSRPQPGAVSSRATNASHKHQGEILLRSDAERKKWRHRELEQNAYVERLSEAIPQRKTRADGHGENGEGYRRMTVLGSEMIPPPPPPQPHKRQPAPAPIFSDRRRGSTAESDRRRSLDSMDVRYIHEPSYIREPTSDSEMPQSSARRQHQHVQVRQRESVVDSDRRRSLDGMDGRHAHGPPSSRDSSSSSEAALPPTRRGPVTILHEELPPVSGRQSLHLRSPDIYRNRRSAVPPPHSNGTEIPKPQSFESHYEELIPRGTGSLLGEQPLQERRQAPLLPKPAPQALTSRRPDPPQMPPGKAHHPLSGRQGGRAPPPPRPDGPMQVRLSLLEKRQMEILQREHQQQHEEEHWLKHEQEQYKQDRRKYRGQDRPEQSDDEQEEQEQVAKQRASAREKDEIAVNSLLAELCEIARMTNEYTQSGSSSLLATAASSNTGDPLRPPPPSS